MAWMRSDRQTRQGCFTHWARATQGRELNGLAAIADLFLTSRRFAPQLWSGSARRRFDLRDMSRSKQKIPTSRRGSKAPCLAYGTSRSRKKPPVSPITNSFV